MTSSTRDVLMRMAAFEHVQSLQQVHDHLTTNELKPGFVFEGNRIPLVNPQRGIFKPQQMQFLLSIKTVFPSSPYLDSSCQGSCSFFRIQLIWALATKLGCWVEARSFAAGPESLSDHLLLLGSLA